MTSEARPPDQFVPSDAPARAFAVDPSRNVVLEASAGTGKTSVLVTRYLNLLRTGVDPSNILAITFTRKAAAEMRERIIRELRKAAPLSEADRARWRDLRDRLGEIAISTIDAFCLSLLREFPLEADLDPGFEVADETETLRLTGEALDRALRVCRALAMRDEQVAYVLARLGEAKARTALESLLGRRLVAARALAAFLAEVPETLTPEAACARAAGRVLQALDSLPGGRDRFLADGPGGNASFALLASDLHGRAAAGDPASVGALLDRLEQHLFTQEGTPRKQFGPLYRKDEFPSEAARKRQLADIPLLAPAVREAISAFERDLNAVVARGVRRMFLVARTEYRRALDARAVVDFTEGLARALRLLGRMDEFAQSRYRLEARYQHVLVDEFQDTSRAQWQLVARLIASWGQGAGLSAEGAIPPSIFIVGDRKQSIYAFRDAEVRVFRSAGRHIAGLREDRDVRRSLAHSFRAAPELQAFANDLFAEVEKDPGRDDAFRYGESDRFPEAAAADAGGIGAVGLVVADAPGALAEAVAAEVQRLLGEEIIRDRQTGVRRRAEPGDVAILFRARESHREFERALTARGVPTYVYKGLGFFDADETKDVVALLRYLADPWSDLRAAAFLRSRFVRLSDAAVRRMSPGAAAALIGADPPPAAVTLDEEDRAVLDRARASVAAWVDLVDRIPHAELLDRILVETAYAFETRGPRLRQARENLKKLRALVRRIQNHGYATLGRIAEHLDRLSTGDESNATIDAVDAVNLMTVHSAKGLEFPVVFVVNLDRGTGARPAPVVVTFAGRARRPLVSVDGMLADVDGALQGRDREETKRLLYVAVTRARDRLYLAASLKDGRLRPRRGSLGQLLPATFLGVVEQGGKAAGGQAVAWTAATGRRHLLRVCGPDRGAVPTSRAGTGSTPASVPDDFGVITDPTAVARTSVTRLVTAKGPGAHIEPDESRTAPRDADAALAGTLVHRLFQLGHAAAAAALSVEGVMERARQLCRASELAAVGRPEALLRDVAETYLTLSRRPDVESVLSSGMCLYEVPFSLALDDGPAGQPARVVRGAIDCLVRRPDGHVTVVDFKTGTPHLDHGAQIAHYVEAARRLCATDDVEGLLIYAKPF